MGLLGSAGVAAGLLLLSVSSAASQGRTLPERLTLEEAIRLAIQSSPQLGGVRAMADAAGADHRAAWGSFLPQASVSMNLGKSDFTRITFIGPEGESETLPDPLSSGSQSSNQSIALNWTLFDQGRRFANLSEQSANLRAAQRQLDDRTAAVVAETGRAFYAALRNQRLLELTEQQILERQLELDIARRRYEIAAVERIDVLAAEGNLLDLQVSLLRTRQQTETSLRTLAVEIGLPAEEGPGTTLADVVDLPSVDAAEGEFLLQEALSGDPEILQLQAQRAAASAGLWGARSSFLPTIQASMNWGNSQSYGLGEPFFQFNPSDGGRNFTLSASWMLFSGFSRVQETAQASSRERQAEEDLRRRRLEIERDVRGFIDQLEQLAGTRDLALRSRQIAQERLDMSRAMYQNGTIDFTALQQAIGGVTSAERQLVDLRFEYLTAWVGLAEFRAVGG